MWTWQPPTRSASSARRPDMGDLAPFLTPTSCGRPPSASCTVFTCAICVDPFVCRPRCPEHCRPGAGPWPGVAARTPVGGVRWSGRTRPSRARLCACMRACKCCACPRAPTRTCTRTQAHEHSRACQRDTISPPARLDLLTLTPSMGPSQPPPALTHPPPLPPPDLFADPLAVSTAGRPSADEPT